jgi:hypothetical protein
MLEERCVRDGIGRRLSSRGIVRMWVNMQVKITANCGELGVKVCSEMIDRETRRGSDGEVVRDSRGCQG